MALFRYVYFRDAITVPDGEYYLALKGTSDNSHPMIESIKFMKG